MSDIGGLSCGAALGPDAFDDLCRRAVLEARKWNITDGGKEKLCRFPLLVAPSLLARLSAWAVALDAEAREAEAELLQRPALRLRLGLPWRVELALRRARCAPVAGCRYARFDFHPVQGGGFAITEGNLDVAGGLNEASGVAPLFAEHVDCGSVAGDPVAAIAASFVRRLGRGATVGILHVTSFVDDHQVARFLAARLEDAGLVPIMVGPAQLRWMGTGACARVGDEVVPLAGVFRFLPADWLPRLDAASRWWRAFQPGATCWMNPPTAILTQSKRFPLTWGELKTPLSTWRALLPETRSARFLGRAKREWVVKPALSHEGHQVGIAGVTETVAYRAITRDARWRWWQWAAQRRFAAASLDTPLGERYPALGVYVVDGRPAGLYGRLSTRPLIDGDAQDAVVLVGERG